MHSILQLKPVPPDSDTSFDRAFTLVELLVVVAVVALLAGLLTAAVLASKRRGREAFDIGSLRQLGVAAQLYTDEYEKAPSLVKELTQSEMTPKNLWSGALDSTKEGIRNRLVAIGGRGKFQPESFRITFLPIGDLNLDSRLAHDSTIVPQERMSNRGWLIDLGPANMNWQSHSAYFVVGRYHRLLMDGSVQTRTHQPIDLETSTGSQCQLMETLYVDVSRADYDHLCRAILKLP